MPELPVDPVSWIVPAAGEAPIRALVAAFYRRVPQDEVLSPLYPTADLAGAEQRLADFLVERCGGPPAYPSVRGHPRLRMRHARFPIDAAARDRWLTHMRAALMEAELDERAREALDLFLADVATFLINR